MRQALPDSGEPKERVTYVRTRGEKEVGLSYSPKL